MFVYNVECTFYFYVCSGIILIRRFKLDDSNGKGGKTATEIG